MNKDTVTISRCVLEELVNPTSERMHGTACGMAQEALNAQRTDEEIMRDGVAAHVRRYVNEERSLNLHVFPNMTRHNDGLLEWILRYEWETGGGITIGMIQRQPGAEVEYHS